jgi:hypothetical protein
LAGKAQRWTPYRFGFDNPIRYSDKSGQFEIDETTAKKYSKRLFKILGNREGAGVTYGCTNSFSDVSHRFDQPPMESYSTIPGRWPETEIFFAAHLQCAALSG